MLHELKRHFAARVSFAFETTLSVKLIFLSLSTAEEAIARVAQRVKQGGHHIPEDVIRRRFEAGRVNLMRLYAPIVDAWALYDNSNAQPELLDWAERT